PGHDEQRAAEFMGLVRALLVQETSDGVALCPQFPDEWTGQNVEVHDVPTAHGRLSFAVRWHGPRPALLWEVVPDGANHPVSVTAPSLDPAFEASDLRGEALLAPRVTGVDR